MIKLLIDESCGLELKQKLFGLNIDVVSVIEVMPGADDAKILEFANQENRIIVTNDKDFGELIFKKGFKHKGVILLKLSIDFPDNRFRVLNSLIEQFGDKLADKFCVVDEMRIRFRTSLGAG